MNLHGIRESGVDEVHGGTQIVNVRSGFKIETPVALGFVDHGAVGEVEGEMVAGRQLVDVPEVSARRGKGDPGSEIKECFGIGFARDEGQREQALEFRGEGETPVVAEIIERLLPKMIAG